MKYSNQLGDLKGQITSAKNILIALPSQIDQDKLASSLALYLSLKQAGKEVSLVTEDIVRVGHTNLYGVDQVGNSIKGGAGGDLTITLEGVVSTDGTVPALEKLDWYPEGQNLNLVFHTLPGQKFEPTRILPRYHEGGFDLIFCLGAQSLNSLGNVYNSNQQLFSEGTLVNIDHNSSNSQFGKLNVIDPQASSLSEMMSQVIPDLGLSTDQDIASNLLSGIYEATSNLTTNIFPETFLTVGQLMQAGGKNPAQGTQTMEQPGSQVITPQNQDSSMSSQTAYPPLNQVFGFPTQNPQVENQPINNSYHEQNNTPVSQTQNTPPQTQSSPEEMPMGEYAGSSNPEMSNPDPAWLNPKVFKSGSIG